MKPTVQNKIRFLGYKVDKLLLDTTLLQKEGIDTNIDIDLGVKSAFSDEGNKSYLIKISLKLKSEDKSEFLECDIVGSFEAEDEVDEEFKLSHFVKVNSPAILFPYLRSYITTVTSNSGISPIIIPPINFTSLSE